MLIMKNTVKYILALTAVAIVTVTACQKKEYTIGDPVSKVEGIDGTWQVSTVFQVDETSPVRESMDLSTYFVVPGTAPLEITFDGQKFTYVVDANGAQNPFGPSGDWEFDNIDYPTYVHLYSSESDTIILKLGQTIRPSDSQLLLDQQRLCDVTPIITYQYTFNRQ
jgi:hypothetical protein